MISAHRRTGWSKRWGKATGIKTRNHYTLRERKFSNPWQFSVGTNSHILDWLVPYLKVIYEKRQIIPHANYSLFFQTAWCHKWSQSFWGFPPDALFIRLGIQVAVHLPKGKQLSGQCSGSEVPTTQHKEEEPSHLMCGHSVQKNKVKMLWNVQMWPTVFGLFVCMHEVGCVGTPAGWAYGGQRLTQGVFYNRFPPYFSDRVSPGTRACHFC